VDAEVRPASPAEWTDVGGLRWDWLLESGGRPNQARNVFAVSFAEWAAVHRASHECFVAAADGLVIGMAWLAAVPRVPSPRAFDRLSGDLQCAYVVPKARGRGVGGRLVDAVLTRAAELGMERVTVHSSPRATAVYRRHGFLAEDRLLHAYVVDPVTRAPVRA
jgi:GNAT superfamily N-acetyltransferase